MKRWFKPKTFLIGIVLFFLTYSLLIGPYIIRNSIYFGEAKVSGRGEDEY